jgi:hypothetical protein
MIYVICCVSYINDIYFMVLCIYDVLYIILCDMVYDI